MCQLKWKISGAVEISILFYDLQSKPPFMCLANGSGALKKISEDMKKLIEVLS